MMRFWIIDNVNQNLMMSHIWRRHNNHIAELTLQQLHVSREYLDHKNGKISDSEFTQSKKLSIRRSNLSKSKDCESSNHAQEHKPHSSVRESSLYATLLNHADISILSLIKFCMIVPGKRKDLELPIKRSSEFNGEEL